MGSFHDSDTFENLIGPIRVVPTQVLCWHRLSPAPKDEDETQACHGRRVPDNLKYLFMLSHLYAMNNIASYITHNFRVKKALTHCKLMRGSQQGWSGYKSHVILALAARFGVFNTQIGRQLYD